MLCVCVVGDVWRFIDQHTGISLSSTRCMSIQSRTRGWRLSHRLCGGRSRWALPLGRRQTARLVGFVCGCGLALTSLRSCSLFTPFPPAPGLIDSIADKTERVSSRVERQTERVSKMRERAGLCSEWMSIFAVGWGAVWRCSPRSLSSLAVPWTVAVLLLIVILIIAVVPINGKP